MNGQEKKDDQGLCVHSNTQKEEETEALLARTLVSHPPPEFLRRQVRKRVAEAWDRRPLSLHQRLEGFFRRPHTAGRGAQSRLWRLSRLARRSLRLPTHRLLGQPSAKLGKLS